MAKSEQISWHIWQLAHLPVVTTTGYRCPLALVSVEYSRTPRGQKSMQRPQPLHSSVMM